MQEFLVCSNHWVMLLASSLFLTSFQYFASSKYLPPQAMFKLRPLLQPGQCIKILKYTKKSGELSCFFHLSEYIVEIVEL